MEKMPTFRQGHPWSTIRRSMIHDPKSLTVRVQNPGQNSHWCWSAIKRIFEIRKSGPFKFLLKSAIRSLLKQNSSSFTKKGSCLALIQSKPMPLVLGITTVLNPGLPLLCMEHYKFEPQIAINRNKQSPYAVQVVIVIQGISRSPEGSRGAIQHPATA